MSAPKTTAEPQVRGGVEPANSDRRLRVIERDGPESQFSAMHIATCRFEASSFDEIPEGLLLRITPWERTALQLLADGAATSALAARFGTSEPDLEAQLSSLYARMGVAGRAEAVAVALRRGLLNAASFTANP